VFCRGNGAQDSSATSAEAGLTGKRAGGSFLSVAACKDNLSGSIIAPMSRYEIDFLPEYTDEALLDELRRIGALLTAGEPLMKTVCKRHGLKVSESTVCKRFGGW